MHPTYTDLRALASNATAAEFRPSCAEAEASFAHRNFIEVKDPVVDIGWSVAAAGSGRVEKFGQHELVIVLDGEIAFQTSRNEILLRAGQSLVIPKGASFQWNVSNRVTFAFMRYHPEEAETSDLVFLDPNVPLSPSGSPLAELLLSETPSCRNNTLYATPTRHWSAGIWDSTPYHRKPMTYAHYEVMHILEGSVCITDDQGRATTFGPDSVLLVPKGAKCSWLSEKHVRKVWGILRIPS